MGWQVRDWQYGIGDFEMPEWAQRRANYLRLVLAVVLIFLLMSNTACTAQARTTQNWRSVAESNIFSAADLNEILDENTSSLTAEEAAELKSDLQIKELTESLVAVDFANPLLTSGNGRWNRFGLLHLTEDGWETVLQGYKTLLPPNFEFVQITEQVRNGFPCVRVNLMPEPVSEIEQNTLCYQPGLGEYRVIDTVRVPFQDKT